MISRQYLSILFSIGAALAISTASSRAEAAQVTCTVTATAWATGGGGTLQLTCGGVWYYAFGTSSACPTANLDARKAWLSLAQSAHLSGKPFYLEYTTCTGGPGITYARLAN